MELANKKINCTNPEWVGRAHCEKCHIRDYMLFSELPRPSFEKFLEPINHYRYLPGSSIYEAGSQKKYIYSIRQGMVKLEMITADGSSRIVRLLGPGTAIGLELLDGKTAYLHNAITISEVDLCKIPVSTLRQIESVYTILGKRIREQLQFQLNMADQWIYGLGTGSAKQRVATLILLLNEFFADKNNEFHLLHRDDMSAMIAIAPDNISRVIAKFKRRMVLVQEESGLYRCNESRLEEIRSREKSVDRMTSPIGTGIQKRKK